MNTNKKTREPLFHLVKRANVPTWQAWSIRLGTIVASFLVIALMAYAALKVAPGKMFDYLFKGTFGGTGNKTLDHQNRMLLLYETALLLLVALAVTPAFKMKFWNIGAEGQVLVGALLCMMCMHYFGGKVNNTALIFISLGAALLAGAVWAVIPALFKAKWNTNETLFTLMMNYVVIRLVVFIIKVWEPNGTGSLTPSTFGHLPTIGGENYWLTIIVAIALTAFMFGYLRYSKHGYEISVVGESENTARYIGIKVKKVIIRTLILSGLVCGLVGFLQVAGYSYTISEDTAGGRGFTAILVSWLAKFNPIVMVFTAFLVAFLTRGMKEVMTRANIYNDYFCDIAIGIIFLMIIACEFFINYKVVFRHRSAETPKSAPVLAEGTSEQTSEESAIVEEASVEESASIVPEEQAPVDVLQQEADAKEE